VRRLLGLVVVRTVVHEAVLLLVLTCWDNNKQASKAA
jgi:hypothetical protein